MIGLPCGVRRVLYGTINIIRALLKSKKSILLVGCLSVSKTNMVTKIALVMDNEIKKRLTIIDTSNEITGDSDVPYIRIGCVRRM